MSVTVPRPALALALVLALVGTARAQDDAPDRTLVLVAPPAVLLDAVETSLAPWQIRIVVVEAADAPPTALADANQAGFVAIGAGGMLHLYDRSDASEQRRPMPADLTEADAAALALTIKTWMRLGPAPTDPTVPAVPTAPPAPIASAEPPAVEAQVPPPTPVRGWQLGASAAFGVRANQGGLDALHARVVLAAGLATRSVDLAAGAELGPSVSVMDGAQPGTWREIVGFARVSHRFGLPRGLALRPLLGVAVMHAAIEGQQISSNQSFAMSGWNLGLDGAFELGWRSGHLLTQVAVGVTALPIAQRLRDRSIKFDLPAHLEPWATIGAEARF